MSRGRRSRRLARSRGARALGNLVLQLVARAEQRVEGVLASELWRPTLPGWRRAGTRAALAVRLAGETDAEGLAAGTVAADVPTLLIVDERHVVTATGTGEALAGVWSSHPLIVRLGRAALASWA